MSQNNHLHLEKWEDNSFWGRAGWRFIHSLAASANTNEKREAFVQFLQTLIKIMPCEVCSKNLERHLKEDINIRDYTTNEYTMFLASYKLHDIVNKELGKESPPLKLVYDQYFNKVTMRDGINKGECNQCKVGNQIPIRSSKFFSKNHKK